MAPRNRGVPSEKINGCIIVYIELIIINKHTVKHTVAATLPHEY